jgi:hypothetical protein
LLFAVLADEKEVLVFVYSMRIRRTKLVLAATIAIRAIIIDEAILSVSIRVIGFTSFSKSSSNSLS